MKKILLILSMVCILFSGCSTEEEKVAEIEKESIKVVLPKSPAAIPVLRMIETGSLGESFTLDLELYNYMEKMMAIATGDDYSFLGIPIHVGSVLKNKGLDIQLINSFLWGGVALSTTDSSFNSWSDLKGKKLFVPAKGSVPDIMTQYFLNKLGGLSIDDVEIVYSNHVEIAQFIKSNKAQYVIDAQPFITFNKNNVESYRVVSDFKEAWKEVEGASYSLPNFGLVVRSEYAKDHVELINKFNDELSKAIDWVKNNPNEAGDLAVKYLNMNKDVIAQAVVDFDYDNRTATEAKNDLVKYYEVLLDFKKESVGRKLPEDSFYYAK